jgi:hypothetical protein
VVYEGFRETPRLPKESCVQLRTIRWWDPRHRAIAFHSAALISVEQHVLRPCSLSQLRPSKSPFCPSRSDHCPARLLSFKHFLAETSPARPLNGTIQPTSTRRCAIPDRPAPTPPLHLPIAAEVHASQPSERLSASTHLATPCTRPNDPVPSQGCRANAPDNIARQRRRAIGLASY